MMKSALSVLLVAVGAVCTLVAAHSGGQGDKTVAPAAATLPTVEALPPEVSASVLPSSLDVTGALMDTAVREVLARLEVPEGLYVGLLDVEGGLPQHFEMVRLGEGENRVLLINLERELSVDMKVTEVKGSPSALRYDVDGKIEMVRRRDGEPPARHGLTVGVAISRDGIVTPARQDSAAPAPAVAGELLIFSGLTRTTLTDAGRRGEGAFCAFLFLADGTADSQ